MDIEGLRCFLAVAACLNFTKAAQTLFMTQSTVSRKIAKLEADMGVILFDRTGPALKLTPAGELCLAETEKILGLIDSLPEKLHGAQNAIKGNLRIGHYGLFDIPMLTDLILQFRKKYPNVNITLYQKSFAYVLEDLCRKDADVVFTITNEAQSMGNAMVLPMYPICICAVMPKTHPLATRTSISISELQGEPLIWWRRAAAPVVYDAIQNGCAKHGFVPKIAETKRNYYDVFLEVASGEGIGLLANAIANFGGEGIASVPIHDLDIDVKYGAVYLPDCGNPCSTIFWHELIEYIKGDRPGIS